MSKKKLRIIREDARRMLFDLPVSRKTEELPLEESYGRVLAEDVIAEENVPPFAKAPLDGYALRGEETEAASPENPLTFRITEEIAAGGVPQNPLTKGFAAKILTGAPMPEGSNTVVRFEETEFTEETVTLTAPVRPYADYVPAGDDIKVGRKIAGKGEEVTPPLAGMMAALGKNTVTVYKKPRVTILSTGSELQTGAAPLLPGKIRNSSYHLLRGYLTEAGAEVAPPTVIADTVEGIAEKLNDALQKSDLVITTGGVSVGDYDLVMAATEKIGAKRLFWKVRFRPGGTMLAAERDGKLILGLSGNPASASLALFVIGMPFVRVLTGRPAAVPRRVTAELLDPITKDSPYGRLVRGKLVLKDGKCGCRVVDNQGNGALSSLLGCDLIIDIPAETPPLAAGALVEAYYIGRDSL